MTQRDRHSLSFPTSGVRLVDGGDGSLGRSRTYTASTVVAQSLASPRLASPRASSPVPHLLFPPVLLIALLSFSLLPSLFLYQSVRQTVSLSCLALSLSFPIFLCPPIPSSWCPILSDPLNSTRRRTTATRIASRSGSVLNFDVPSARSVFLSPSPSFSQFLYPSFFACLSLAPSTTCGRSCLWNVDVNGGPLPRRWLLLR